jgi:hypothetical protein
MPGKRHLEFGRENAHFGGVRRVFRRQDEGRLRQVELVGDGLHLRGAQPGGIRNNGQRVAAEAPFGKDIDGDEFDPHLPAPFEMISLIS